MMNCSKQSNGVITSEGGYIFPLSDIYENTVVLIFSYECGYSLDSIEEFNKLKTEVELDNPHIKFIALTEFKKEKSVNEYPSIKKIIEKNDLKWEKFPEQEKLTKSLTKIIVYPQLIYLKDGKMVERIEAPYKHEIEKFKDLILQKN